ncbi:NCS2 family permease [Zavarzinella formosa]|uniref:NCS2 family permease n=1 Tax=Zavarzinella formosa TaxID=360055 RepID=UPI0002FE4516|nr:NCS2 family permease [Zavarzinella formosa]
MTSKTGSGLSGALDRFFGLNKHGTTARIEVLGGATTFATMAYIIVVNPAILQFAGLPLGPATVATILTAVFGSLLMGLYANRPLAVAPYMGENAFLAFGLTAMGIGWQLRLGAVFVSGAIFLLLTLSGIRSWLANSISPSMKHSFAAGIGLFLAFIGLYQTGIVTSFTEGMPAPKTEFLARPAVPLKIGNWRDPKVLLALGGLMVIITLMCRRIRGAILVGIIVTAIIGYLMGEAEAPVGIVALPITGEYDLSPLAFQLDITGVFHLSFLPILLTLFLMSFLDTFGTLTGVGAAGKMLDSDGNFPQMERPMLVDACSCMFAALAGSSTSGAYIESATGVREGARTGLAAVTTALLFALTLFFIPMVKPLQQLGYAYGPALIAVGILMIGSVRNIDFDDLTEGVPAFVTFTMIVFTYNIANGLTVGLIIHPLLKVVAGRFREIRPGAVLLGLACLGYYLFGLPH